MNALERILRRVGHGHPSKNGVATETDTLCFVIDDIQTLIARWQAAMLRRDKLQNAVEKLANANDDGINRPTNALAQIEAALRQANAEVEQLQAAVLSSVGKDE